MRCKACNRKLSDVEINIDKITKEVDLCNECVTLSNNATYDIDPPKVAAMKDRTGFNNVWG